MKVLLFALALSIVDVELTKADSASKYLGLDGVSLRFKTTGTITVADMADQPDALGSGQFSAWVDFDFEKMFNVPGVSLHARFDQNWGRSFNGKYGMLLPLDTVSAFPSGRDHSRDLSSLYVDIKVPGQFSLNIGKINMVEKATAIPLLGGGSDGGFSHLGLAAPASGVTPPYLFGALGTLNLPWGVVSGAIYDPVSANRRSPFNSLFSNGASVMVGLTVPTSFAGLRGFQSIKLVTSTSKGLDFNQFDDLLLGGIGLTPITRKHGIWYASYGFQQYIWQDDTNSKRGWGVFAQVAMSDGNPTFLDWSFLGGLSGSSPITGREDDRFGIGYFRYSVSDELAAGLAPILSLRDEEGLELFYNIALTENVRVSLNGQYIRPALQTVSPITTFGLTTSIRF